MQFTVSLLGLIIIGCIVVVCIAIAYQHGQRKAWLEAAKRIKESRLRL